MSLAPRTEQLISKGECLRDRELARIFHGVELGGWSLTVNGIDWLVDCLHRWRPRVVLEFGSGVSTVCLCVILRRLHGPEGFRVLSLDQDLRWARRTRQQLDGVRGRACCRVVRVPLIPTVVDGRSTFRYDLAHVDREHFNWLGKAEFVLIDGPFADGPCRYETLPSVRAHLVPGARFVMDDALREKELAAGALWVRDGIAVEEVFTLGPGLMVGRVA